jgi:hypothetical protein
MRWAPFVVLAAAVSATLLGASTAPAADASACKSAHPKAVRLYCNSTATIRVGTKVHRYTGVRCTVELQTSNAPVQVFAKNGFLLKTLFDRHKSQTSTAEFLAEGGKTGVIDVSVKAKISKNRRSGTFASVTKTPKVSGSFTCK